MDREGVYSPGPKVAELFPADRAAFLGGLGRQQVEWQQGPGLPELPKQEALVTSQQLV